MRLIVCVLSLSGAGAVALAAEWLAPGWDILRVTSRGEAAPAASLTVKRFPDGAAVILK